MGAGLRLWQHLREKPDRDTPDGRGHDVRRRGVRGGSVCANTAEAWRRRHYPSALVAKLIDAEAEAAETRVHIAFAHACGYLPTEVATDLDTRYDRLLARLTAMRTRPEKWVPRQASTPHPQAPEKKVNLHRQPSAPATPAQDEPTKSPPRPEDSPRPEPPSTLEGAETPAGP